MNRYASKIQKITTSAGPVLFRRRKPRLGWPGLTQHAIMRGSPRRACSPLLGHWRKGTLSPCPRDASRASISVGPSWSSTRVTEGPRSGRVVHDPGSILASVAYSPNREFSGPRPRALRMLSLWRAAEESFARVQDEPGLRFSQQSDCMNFGQVNHVGSTTMDVCDPMAKPSLCRY